MISSEEQQRRYKDKLVTTLKAFDVICKENDIKYYACGGTAIGAVRHNGIIPWDDDIDVCMLKPDYDRFMALKEKIKQYNYQIIDYHDNGYYLPYAKFIDTRTTLWEVVEYECVIGAFIDIFPLYYTVEDVDVNLKIWKKYIKTFEKYALGIRKFDYSGFFYAIKGFHLGIIRDYIRGGCFYKFMQKKSKANFDKLVCELSKNKGNRLMNFYTFYPVKKEILKVQWFESQIEFPFEDTTIMLPNGYREYLAQLFGDYMTPPPVEKRTTHHQHFYLDLDRHLTLAEIKRMKHGK